MITKRESATRRDAMRTMQATPTKLKGDGEKWGVRISGYSRVVKIGDRITVTTTSGESWDATVTRIVWTGGGVTIAESERYQEPVASGDPVADYHAMVARTKAARR
jgi:hypothetical protein